MSQSSLGDVCVCGRLIDRSEGAAGSFSEERLPLTPRIQLSIRKTIGGTPTRPLSLERDVFEESIREKEAEEELLRARDDVDAGDGTPVRPSEMRHFVEMRNDDSMTSRSTVTSSSLTDTLQPFT